MPTYKFTKNITLHSYTNQNTTIHYCSPFLNYEMSCIIAFPSFKLKKFISNSQILNKTNCQLISLFSCTTIFFCILTVQIIVAGHRHFEGTCCLHLQRNGILSRQTLQLLPRHNSTTPKMTAAQSAKTHVSTSNQTQCQNPQ